MILIKKEPLTIAEISNKQEYPINCPRDSKSYAMFIQHGALATIVETEMRMLSWGINSSAFSVHENKNQFTGIFHVDVPKVVISADWSVCVGVTNGYSRRQRLTLYVGALNKDLRLGITIASYKASRMIFGKDFASEIAVMLNNDIFISASALFNTIGKLEYTKIKTVSKYKALLEKRGLLPKVLFYELLDVFENEQTAMGFLLGYSRAIKARPDFGKLQWQEEAYNIVTHD